MVKLIVLPFSLSSQLKIVRSCAVTAKKFTKTRDARAIVLLFKSIVFRVFVAVAAVVSLGLAS